MLYQGPVLLPANWRSPVPWEQKYCSTKFNPYDKYAPREQIPQKATIAYNLPNLIQSYLSHPNLTWPTVLINDSGCANRVLRSFFDPHWRYRMLVWSCNSKMQKHFLLGLSRPYRKFPESPKHYVSSSSNLPPAQACYCCSLLSCLNVERVVCTETISSNRDRCTLLSLMLHLNSQNVIVTLVLAPCEIRAGLSRESNIIIHEIHLGFCKLNK